MEHYFNYLKTLEPIKYDQPLISSTDKFMPFALTDVFTGNMGSHSQAILHFWELSDTVILGMKDSRVPNFEEAVKMLRHQHYDVILRNSGGLGIVADDGVLNISFILPNTPSHSLSIEQAYEVVTEMIQKTFQQYTQDIVAKEITDSYCPGTFDLSIHGKKFAGIAQRRIKEGVSVMIYLSINGPQTTRGELMREFYQLGLKEAFGTQGYPPVNPASMQNLSDLFESELTMSQVKEMITTTFQSYFATPIRQKTIEEALSVPEFAQQITKQTEKMIQRNEGLKNF